MQKQLEIYSENNMHAYLRQKMYFFSTVNMIHQKEENNGVDSDFWAPL